LLKVPKTGPFSEPSLCVSSPVWPPLKPPSPPSPHAETWPLPGG